ncbi:MAG: Uma2 family endonuclease, partial [Streptomyces sp.]|nr:Uma2 family endonuclease [Streptomyces sp.]
LLEQCMQLRPDLRLYPERGLKTESNQRDRFDKPDGYAAAGIPVYLLIDRDDCSVVVFNQPEKGRYRHQEKLPFGATVKLPEPVGITLDTEPLKEFAD